MKMIRWEDFNLGHSFNEFLKEIENRADSEFQTEEGRRCVADIKILQSLSDKELGKKIRAYLHCLKIPEGKWKPIVAKIKSATPFKFDPLDDQAVLALAFLSSMLCKIYDKKNTSKRSPLWNAIEKSEGRSKKEAGAVEKSDTWVIDIWVWSQLSSRFSPLELMLGWNPALGKACR